MRQITAIVKPHLAQKVVTALAEFPIAQLVVREVRGYGRQKNYLDLYGLNEYSLAFLPKVQITCWVADEGVEQVVQRVSELSRSGRMGDGKVLVLPVQRVISLEPDEDAPTEFTSVERRISH